MLRSLRRHFGLFDGLKELSADNYTWLTEDALYFNAYLSSIIIAGISTILTLLVGYPIAYGMARAPTTLRPILLMLVILPFWTIFLIRVYAWIGILKPEGLLNQLLLALDVIDQPLIIINTHSAIFIGIVYSYLPFMVLPLYSALEKMDYSLIEAAQDLGCPPTTRLLEDHLPAVAAGRHCRLPAGLHPGGRRVRHPRPARRLADADDRQDLWNEFFSNRDWPVSSAVAVILLLAAGRADHDLPAGAGARPGSRGARRMMGKWSRFNISSIVAGLCLPLSADRHPDRLLLQRLQAGHGVGRLLDQMVRLDVCQQGADGCRLGDGARRRHLGDRSRPSSARWRRSR